MRRRLLFPLFFFIGSCCFPLAIFSQDIHFNLVQDALEETGQVLKITQDAQGFLWLATASGLFKYDGYQFKSYRYQPLVVNSPAGTYIETVIVDRDGMVWLAPQRSGLDRLDPVTGEFTHYRHNKNDPGSLASDTVAAILQDREGNLWVGTFQGLDKFDPNTHTFIHHQRIENDPTTISCNNVRSIFEDSKGTIWVGTGEIFLQDIPGNEGGLNKMDKAKGSFTRFMPQINNPQSLGGKNVQVIFEDSRHNLWVGSNGKNGLQTLDRKTGQFQSYPYDSLNPEKLSRPEMGHTISYGEDHITFIREDSRNRLWIGTFEGGINVYDPQTQKVTFYGVGKNGLDDDHFWAAYETRDNIMWIATWENKLYRVYPFQKSLPSTKTMQPVNFFAEDNNGELWMSTMNGLIHMNKAGQQEFQPIDKNSTSRGNPFFKIEKDKDKFWLSSNHGLYRFDPDTRAYTGFHPKPGDPNSLVSDSTFELKKTWDNHLLIGTYYGLDMMDQATGTWKHFKNKPGDSTSLSNNEVHLFCVGKNHKIWIGTANGLNLFNKQQGTFKRYLKNFIIFGIIEDSDDNLWVGTSSGLYKYNKVQDDFFIFKDRTDLITTAFIGMIVEDYKKNLWISSPKGIFKIDKDRSNVIVYGANQGVNGSDLTGFGYIRQNGEILFSDTANRFFNFQPALMQQNVFPPTVNINDFLIGNKRIFPSSGGILSESIYLTKEIHLKYNQNTFSFEFSCIDFTSGHANTHMQYMLENYDHEWHKVGEEKKAYYFNLPQGKYIFKVQAFNLSGIAGEKDIEIIITPPWWTTWWAYTLFAVLFAAILRFYIQYRSRKLKRENKLLEEKVETRTNQLNKSLEELKSTQTQLIQSEKMASLGELTAGIAHEIQNPLNFVNNFSEVNTELIDEAEREISNGNISDLKTIFTNIRENEQKILLHGKRADAIVKGMLQHSRSNNGVKEPADINALTDEYMKLSYHGLRAKDKSFNATLLSDFDISIPKINIIPQDIARVLINLFNNAFYAVTEKKKLHPVDYTPTVSVITKKLHDHVEIIVKDNGSGIPRQVIDKIFQPFFTTKPTGQGTGLGLSLSYDIIRAHGGELKAETREGEYTQFIIHMPLG